MTTSITKSSPHWARSVSLWQVTILVALALIRGLIYLSLFPPWIAPDEPAHFEMVKVLGQEGQLPDYSYFESSSVNTELSDSFLKFRMWELLERPTPVQFLDTANLARVSFINYPYPGSVIFADAFPILPYLFLSPLARLTSSFDIVTELYVLRFISVLAVIGVVVIAWFIVKEVFPTRPQFWLAIPSFILFLPMHTHIFASLNTDTFAILLTSVLLLLMVISFKNGLSVWKAITIIGLVILAVLTKRTVVFTLLWVPLAGILFLGYRRRWSTGRTVGVGLVAFTLIAVGLALVVFYPGLLANSSITTFNSDFARPLSQPLILEPGLSAAELAEIYLKSGLFAFITFWGDFGGANINIPWPWAWGLMVLCGLLILGAGVFLLRVFRDPAVGLAFQRNVYVVFILGLILSLVNAFFPVLVAGPRWGPPARYFFPVIIPIAVFFFLGAWQLFPAKLRDVALLPLWLFALVAYDSLVITRVLVPFLYG